MALAEELRLMAKTARLYYERGLSQSEIAAQLDLSQATVSRLLKRALDQKIVQISVALPAGFHADLEEELQRKYNLKEAIVVDASTDDDDDQIQRALGAAGAFYLQSTLKHREIIGLSSWSATLLATVDAMRPLPHPIDAQVLQILGGIGNPGTGFHANRLTERFARLVHGHAIFLPAPGVVGSEETLQVMLQDQFVSEVLALFDQVTLALVGIGDVEPSKLLVTSGNRFSPEELDLLRAKGAVGDVCLRFFDKDGIPVETPLNNRVISMSFAQLRKVKRTIGIAGGMRKVTAIRGALVGGWVNVLITDRIVAEALVK